MTQKSQSETEAKAAFCSVLIPEEKQDDTTVVSVDVEWEGKEEEEEAVSSTPVCCFSCCLSMLHLPWLTLHKLLQSVLFSSCCCSSPYLLSATHLLTVSGNLYLICRTRDLLTQSAMRSARRHGTAWCDQGPPWPSRSLCSVDIETAFVRRRHGFLIPLCPAVALAASPADCMMEEGRRVGIELKIGRGCGA